MEQPHLFLSMQKIDLSEYAARVAAAARPVTEEDRISEAALDQGVPRVKPQTVDSSLSPGEIEQSRLGLAAARAALRAKKAS